jgi:hypothetical protein
LVAVLLSVFGYFATFMMMLLLLKWMGNHLSAYMWCFWIPTAVGVSIGVMIIPKRHRECGIWVFIGAANLFVAIAVARSGFKGTLDATDPFSIMGSIVGSVTTWLAFRPTWRSDLRSPAEQD